MIPQILQQLGAGQATTPGLAQIKNLMNMARMMQNPAQAIQQIPQLRQAMDIVNQAGGNPEKAFYALAKQKGIDPESILSQLR